MGWINSDWLAGVAGDPGEADATAWKSQFVHQVLDDDCYSYVAVGRDLGNIRDRLPHKMPPQPLLRPLGPGTHQTVRLRRQQPRDDVSSLVGRDAFPWPHSAV